MRGREVVMKQLRGGSPQRPLRKRGREVVMKQLRGGSLQRPLRKREGEGGDDEQALVSL